MNSTLHQQRKYQQATCSLGRSVICQSTDLFPDMLAFFHISSTFFDECDAHFVPCCQGAGAPTSRKVRTPEEELSAPHDGWTDTSGDIITMVICRGISAVPETKCYSIISNTLQKHPSAQSSISQGNYFQFQFSGTSNLINLHKKDKPRDFEIDVLL